MRMVLEEDIHQDWGAPRRESHGPFCGLPARPNGTLGLCCLEEFREEGLRSCLLTTKPFAQNFAGMPTAVVH